MRKFLGLALAIISLLVLAACVPFPFGGLAPGQQPYPNRPEGGTGPGMMGRGGGQLKVIEKTLPGQSLKR